MIDHEVEVEALAQHDDDVGAEMRERELPEPDDTELVGALLAQIGYTVADLATPDNCALLVDNGRDDLARDVYALDMILQQLITIRDDMAQALAALMEDDGEMIAGYQVKRTKSDRVEWDKDGSWKAARATILDRWARTGATIDTDKGDLIGRTLDDVATAFAITPRVTGLKAIGVNPHEYRAVTPATRYAVKVTG